MTGSDRDNERSRTNVGTQTGIPKDRIKSSETGNARRSTCEKRIKSQTEREASAISGWIDTARYLSDEELEDLIAETENEKIVKAPGDLAERILASLGTFGEDDPGVEITPNKKQEGETVRDKARKNGTKRPSSHGQKEFRIYCIRVIGSMAAAIALTFTLPALSGERLWQTQTKDEVLDYRDTKSKQEVIDRQTGRKAERKESVYDTKILSDTFGGVHIFREKDSPILFGRQNDEEGDWMK